MICYSKGAWRHRARPPIGTFDPHANVGRKRMSQFSLVRSAADMVSMHVPDVHREADGRLTEADGRPTVSAVAIVA